MQHGQSCATGSPLAAREAGKSSGLCFGFLVFFLFLFFFAEHTAMLNKIRALEVYK